MKTNEIRHKIIYMHSDMLFLVEKKKSKALVNIGMSFTQ